MLCCAISQLAQQGHVERALDLNRYFGSIFTFLVTMGFVYLLFVPRFKARRLLRKRLARTHNVILLKDIPVTMPDDE